MNNYTQTNNLYREKLALFIKTINKTAKEFSSTKEKISFYKKIIKNCEEIYECCQVFEEDNPGVELLSKVICELDPNFEWLLNDDKKGPDLKMNGLIKEDEKYYLSAEMLNAIGGNICGFMDGIKNVKFAFELELKKVEAVMDEKAGYEKLGNTIRKVSVKSSMTDIVRIFEAMKEAGIISDTKTEVSQIADIFFSDTLDKKKFESMYNARKYDVNELERNSNSSELEDFIKILTEKSFGKKDKVLERLIRHMERIEKNSIY